VHDDLLVSGALCALLDDQPAFPGVVVGDRGKF
jgi:hypothetical protein